MDKMDLFSKATEDLEKQNKKTPAFGIDLGTTNSCIAVVQAGNTPKLITLNNGRQTLPSCVMWKGKDKFIVGEEAYKNRYKPSVIYSVKRLMGTDEKITLKYGTKLKVMTPVEVSAEILKELVKQASEQYKDIKDVVITVPARFNNRQVEDTKKAGELAGLNVLGILREPTSASLCYEMENFGVSEEKVLVYDLGGGTFDSSLLRIKRNTGDIGGLEELYGAMDTESNYSMMYSVIDTDGDTSLGGDDIDHEMYKILETKLKDLGINPEDITHESKEKLVLRMERLKKSGPSAYDVDVDIKLKGGKRFHQYVHITPSDFAEATSVIYNKTKSIVNNVLRRTSTDSITGIVLVGGSTKSTIIKELLRRDFPDVTINEALDPDLAVGLGAAIKAKEAKFNDKSIEVFDVLPLSIGILSNNNIKSIIPSNQRVPHVAKEVFTTVQDGQTEIEVNVYQGNSPLVEESLYLGTLLLKVPENKAGKELIYVTLSVDSNGLLTCMASTGSDSKKVELVNLFGSSQSKKLSADEKRISRWKSFANKLNEEGKREVLEAVSMYESEKMSLKEVSSVISKYAKYETEFVAPSIHKDELAFEE